MNENLHRHLSSLAPDVPAVSVSQTETPTVASAAKATRGRTVSDSRSLWPAGGSAAGMESVAFQRVGRPSVTVSQDTPGPPVTQVKARPVKMKTGTKTFREGQ